MVPEIAIVDYSLGNLQSIVQACRATGLRATVTSDAGEIAQAGAVILPGVGAFKSAMDELARLGLVNILREYADSGHPLIGICLGFQLLMDRSEEFGDHEGLGLVRGTVVRFPALDSTGQRIKVPQIGWNRVHTTCTSEEAWNRSALRGIPTGTHMYFVHSYYVQPAAEESVVALTTYGGISYCSALQAGNVLGFQFHPERSGTHGLRIYQNLAQSIAERIE